MSEHIRKIVTTAAGTVPSGYTDKVDAVVEALSTAAEGIAEALVAKGVSMGGDEDDLNALMVEVGLVDPQPEAGSDSFTAEETPAWASDLINRLDRLERAARARGLNV